MSRKVVFALCCLAGAWACTWNLMTALGRPPWTAIAITWRKHRGMWDAYCRWDLEER